MNTQTSLSYHDILSELERITPYIPSSDEHRQMFSAYLKDLLDLEIKSSEVADVISRLQFIDRSFVFTDGSWAHENIAIWIEKFKEKYQL